MLQKFTVVAVPREENRKNHQVYHLSVIDDGSTDGTRARLQSYGDRLHYVDRENNSGGFFHA